jgi:hypothetical protein
LLSPINTRNGRKSIFSNDRMGWLVLAMDDIAYICVCIYIYTHTHTQRERERERERERF